MSKLWYVRSRVAPWEGTQGLCLAVCHAPAPPCLEEASCCRERLQPEEKEQEEEEEDVARAFREQEATPVDANAARGRPQHGDCADARCIAVGVVCEEQLTPSTARQAACMCHISVHTPRGRDILLTTPNHAIRKHAGDSMKHPLCITASIFSLHIPFGLN